MVLAAFPNPFLLPFLGAGGMVSGTTFGLFYTVMMQIGYNYYGKKALTRLEEGDSLEDILLDISKDIQPFTEKALTIALEALPKVLTESTEALKELFLGSEKEFVDWVRSLIGMPPTGESYEDYVASFNDAPAPPPPPPDNYDWQKDTVTETETVQEVLDRLKKNDADYAVYVSSLPQELMDTYVNLKPYLTPVPNVFLVKLKDLIDSIINYRRSIELGTIAQDKFPARILLISQISNAVHQELGFWI